MSYYIIFSDGTYNYRIDDEGFLVVLTDERDEKGDYREVHTIGPEEMEGFIEWLRDESRRRARERADNAA